MKKKSNIFTEFRDFINRGNVIDMAVGVIIGGAFTAIVNSFVKDVITPVIGIFTGGIDFSNLTVTLRKATEGKEALTLNYGSFITAVINFLIIAFVVFNFVKLINVAKNKAEAKKKAEEDAKKAAEEAEAAKRAEDEAAKPKEPTEAELLAEIRDLLKKKG